MAFLGSRIEIGAQFELKAVVFLKNLGYEILERNFRLRFGEIDIIARDGETVVFVEVRYRANNDFGAPMETIGPVKRRKIRRTALAYVSGKGLDCPMRFDVVSIEADRLEHIPDAFT